MSTNVTVQLPDEVYHQAMGLAQRTGRDLIGVLSDLVTMSLSLLTAPSRGARSLADMSDTEIMDCTSLQMSAEQDGRLSQLLDRQQAAGLSPSERVELLALMQVYQDGLLGKALALEEAVRRGLRPPLAS